MAHQRAPGLMAVAHHSDASAPPPDLRRALDRLGFRDVSITPLGSVSLATWGLGHARPTAGHPLLLSATNWSERGAVGLAEIDRWLARETPRPDVPMLPPFGAIAMIAGGVAIASDTMGFRQLFRRVGAGWSAISTSARALGALDGGGLDRDAVQLQSLLGWQLAQRTLFDGVTKLRPGEYVRLDGEGWSGGVTSVEPLQQMSLEEAARRAAALLRSSLERYLDETTDPVLQLTGGQDSRLVLSAIPPGRRKGLRVMTMGTPGNPDVDIAARLAARDGMEHLVQGLEGLDQLSSGEAFDRACEAAARLDCMADPIAKAATIWAEERFPQGPRLSGLGGELARGFYYTGRVREVPVSRRRAEGLARWRMFVNEAVEAAALDQHFAANARSAGMELVYRSLRDTGLDWYRATDVLYHDHRMQRWAGLSESSVCFDRQIVNPMLDDRFRAIADALAPADKAQGRFLARLQVELDADLAAIPLDNRPAPALLARPGVANRLRYHAATAKRLARKVRQRVAGERRPPAGGAVLSKKIADHLAEVPGTIDPVRDIGVFDPRWLDGLVSRKATAEPGSLALLVNLLVAAEASTAM